MIKWETVKCFTPEEFDDPLFPGSGKIIDPVLLFNLVKLRNLTNWPIITHWQAGGCVDVEGRHGHAVNSYHLSKNGCKAVDFHFKTDSPPRMQFSAVATAGFTGIGVYYDWHYHGEPINIGFHVDIRPVQKAQIWRREKGRYFYFLH